MTLDFGAFMQPEVLGLWIVVGCVAGLIARKIFYRSRRGGGGFTQLLQTCILGMVGSFIGIMAGMVLGLPGANELGLLMALLALAGTLLLVFIVSLIQR